MKTNFSNSELGFIAKAVGTDMAVRFTPYGNIVAKHTKAKKILFSIYKREEGIIIRRRLGYDKALGGGNILNGGKALPDLKTAMEYFVRYKKKYPKSVV